MPPFFSYSLLRFILQVVSHLSLTSPSGRRPVALNIMDYTYTVAFSFVYRLTKQTVIIFNEWLISRVLLKLSIDI